MTLSQVGQSVSGVTDAGVPAVVVKRSFKATREALFRAWTDPAMLMKWWGPPGCQALSAKVDLRVGGGYSFTTQPGEGEAFQHGGSYREISPPERLVFTWMPPDGGCGGEEIGETLVTVEFRDLGGATELVLRHELLPTPEARDSHREGWTGTLESLGDFLTATPQDK